MPEERTYTKEELDHAVERAVTNKEIFDKLEALGNGQSGILERVSTSETQCTEHRTEIKAAIEPLSKKVEEHSKVIQYIKYGALFLLTMMYGDKIPGWLLKLVM